MLPYFLKCSTTVVVTATSIETTVVTATYTAETTVVYNCYQSTSVNVECLEILAR